MDACADPWPSHDWEEPGGNMRRCPCCGSENFMQYGRVYHGCPSHCSPAEDHCRDCDFTWGESSQDTYWLDVRRHQRELLAAAEYKLAVLRWHINGRFGSEPVVTHRMFIDCNDRPLWNLWQLEGK